MAILKFAAIALSVVCAACQREPTFLEFSDQHVVVHALLIAGQDSVQVLVSRAVSGSVSDQATGVSNAQVRLTGPSQDIALTRGGRCVSNFSGDVAINETGCYSAFVPGGITAGALYEIAITVPGLPTIRGATRVPAQPVILAPAANSQLPFPSGPDTVEPVEIAWTVVHAAAPVTVHLDANDANCRAGFRIAESVFGIQRWLEAHGSGTASAVIGFWNCVGPPSSEIPGFLVVTAYDDNYETYARTTEDAVPPAEASAGLTGAFGVFASAARSAIPVQLVRR